MAWELPKIILHNPLQSLYTFGDFFRAPFFDNPPPPPPPPRNIGTGDMEDVHWHDPTRGRPERHAPGLLLVNLNEVTIMRNPII